MGPRGKFRRLENSLRGYLASFELEDGPRHYYDPTSGEMFLHNMACLRAQVEGKTTFPEPPETLRAILRARNRAAALTQAGYSDILPYDKEAIVERGKLVLRSIVVGRELGKPLPDLSE